MKQHKEIFSTEFVGTRLHNLGRFLANGNLAKIENLTKSFYGPREHLIGHLQATLNLANWHKTPNCAEFKRLRHAEFSAYVFHSSESFLCRTLVFSLILVVLVLNGGIFTHSSVFDVGIFTYFSFQL